MQAPPLLLSGRVFDGQCRPLSGVVLDFWLADAYSVAPTPVCLLLSAAMSELGLYALARGR